MSVDDSVLLLEVAEDGIGTKGGGIHYGIERGLEVFRVVPECIQKKDDLNLVKVH